MHCPTCTCAELAPPPSKREARKVLRALLSGADISKVAAPTRYAQLLRARAWAREHGLPWTDEARGLLRNAAREILREVLAMRGST